MKKLTIMLCLLAWPAMAQSNQEMLDYLVQQDLQRQQQAQQPAYGLNEQQWEQCRQDCWAQAQMAPKHGGGSLLEGYGQTAQCQQGCGPRPQ